MKNLLLITVCVLLIAVPAGATKQKYGPIPNYNGTKPASASVNIPTTGSWFVYNPVTQNTIKFGAWGGGEYWFHYTAPVFVNSYIEVNPSAPVSESMRLVEAVTYNEQPDELYSIPDQRGFTAANPEVTPGNPTSFFFAGKAGVQYAASVVTIPVGQLQSDSSPLQGFDTSKIGGPSNNLVHVISATIPAGQAPDFIGQFEFTIEHISVSPSGDPCLPWQHSFQLNITQWDPAVPKIGDIDHQTTQVVPGYVTVVTPPNWVYQSRTFGRSGYWANPGNEITNGTGSFGWTVNGKTPYVIAGHTYLTNVDHQLCSPVINSLMLGPDPNSDCGMKGYLEADLNQDCKVNFQDFSTLAARWLQNTDPKDPTSIQQTIVGLGIMFDPEDTVGPAKIQALWDAHTSGVEVNDVILEYQGIPTPNGAALHIAMTDKPLRTVGQFAVVAVKRASSIIRESLYATILPTSHSYVAHKDLGCTTITNLANGATSCACMTPNLNAYCNCYMESKWYDSNTLMVRSVCSDWKGQSCQGTWAVVH